MMSPALTSALRWLLPVVLAAALAVGGLGVLWWKLEPIAEYLGVPAGERLDIVRVYLLAVGGGLLIWQVSIANRRATSAERVAELTELGNITDRMNSAIANLGSENAVVRIGALYQLHHIAIDAPSYRRTVYELVRSHFNLIASTMDDSALIDSPLSAELSAIARMLYQRIADGGVYHDQDEENGR